MITRKMQCIFCLAFLMFLLVPSGYGDTSYQFYAVYDWLVDYRTASANSQEIYYAGMSADGTVVAFTTQGSNRPGRVYLCNPDGSNLRYVEPDALAKNLSPPAISEDGSKIFVIDPYVKAIYKIQGGTATKINLAFTNGPNLINSYPKTIASGAYVYFLADDDLWRASQDGSSIVKLINDASVPYNGGVGYSIQEFAISADGGTILYRFWGYSLNGVHGLSDLFIYRNGSSVKITQDGQGKLRLGINQDGSTVVWMNNGEWFAANSAGQQVRDLGSGDRYSNEFPAMTYDGSKFFVHDGGGRLVRTDGSGQFDITMGFPLYLSVYRSVCITRDGAHVLFQSDQTNDWAIFYGHLNDEQALVTSAPHINSINFSPYAMVRNNTSAKVIMRTALSSPAGLTDLKTVGQAALINGITEGNFSNLPVYFQFQPLDNGAAPDTAAGDGVYATQGVPGGKITQLDGMTYRVGVKNGDKTFVMADVTLPVVNALASLTVNSPNGGESWQAGTVHNITWSQTGLAGNVTIDLYRSITKVATIGTPAASAGTFQWTIPSNQVPANDYRVRIYQNSVEDYSNAAFAILAGVQTLRMDLIGTWDGSGVYYWNSDTEAWVYLSTPASMLCTGDIDGDGTDDLVGIWSSGVWVRYTSSGQWQLITSSVPSWIGAGDLTNDGRADIAGIWGGTVWGRDSATGAWYTIATNVTMGALADLDGDGKVDLVGVWPTQGGIWVRYASTGTWQNLSSAPDFIAAGDLNGDGKDDVIGIWGSVVWARDSATGTWSVLTSGASKIAAGDLDGDGKADLLGIWQGNGVWVNYSATSAWRWISSPARWICTGRLR